MLHLVVLHATRWCGTCVRRLDRGGALIRPCLGVLQQRIDFRDGPHSGLAPSENEDLPDVGRRPTAAKRSQNTAT